MTPRNIYALSQAGYTKPKEHYSEAELSRLSTSHLRRLARNLLGMSTKKSRRTGDYLLVDIGTNGIVGKFPGTEEDLRDELIELLSDNN